MYSKLKIFSVIGSTNRRKFVFETVCVSFHLHILANGHLLMLCAVINFVNFSRQRSLICPKKFSCNSWFGLNSRKGFFPYTVLSNENSYSRFCKRLQSSFLKFLLALCGVTRNMLHKPQLSLQRRVPDEIGL